MRYQTFKRLLSQHGWSLLKLESVGVVCINGNCIFLVRWDGTDAYISDEDDEEHYIRDIQYIRFYDEEMIIEWNDGDEWNYAYDDDDYDDDDDVRRQEQSHRDRSNSHNPNNPAFRHRMNQKSNAHNPCDSAYWESRQQSYRDRHRNLCNHNNPNNPQYHKH